MNLHITHIKQKGFTLLFTILVSTLVISIASTIMSIAIRQTILSSTARESQYAFYAANAALECAFYWDNASTTGAVFPIGKDAEVTNKNIVTCAGGNIITGNGFDSDSDTFDTGAWDSDRESSINSGITSNTTTFKMVLESQDNDVESPKVCAEAEVKKELQDNGIVKVTILTKGYNTCEIDSPRAVERGIVIEYRT